MLLVGVKTAVMLSAPEGSVLVGQVADVGGLMATAVVHPVIADEPTRNSTVPAGLVLSAAEAVAVNVTEVPKAGLVLLADNVVVVAVFGGAPTVTTTAGEVEEAYELLVGVKTAVMLSAPEGSVLVGQVADVGGLMATAVQPLIGVVPFKNSTVPAGLVLSAAEAVAVNVTEVPKAGLVLLADNVVVVAVFGGAPTVTTTAGEVEEAYELLVGVKTAVMLSAPEGSVLVGQVADVGGLMATAVQPLIGVVPFKNSTVPAGLVLSAAEAVAVNVTEVPKAGLVLLADNVVVVAVFGGAPTVTTTAGEVEEAYELLVGVKTAVMLSAPEGSVLVGQVADVGGLMATAVQPLIGVVPFKNSTVPAGLVLSAAEAVAVNVTEVPKAGLVLLADNVVVVAVFGGAPTVTTTAGEVEEAYELLVGVKTAVMLSAPEGSVLVGQVADVGGLMATAVQPLIGVVPFKNSTVPAGLVLSAAEAVAVNVTEVPKAGLVLLADNVVVVAVFGGAPTVTTTAGEVEEAYELLVGVKTAVMLSAPEGSVLVGQVADVGGLMATAVQPLIGVVPFKNSTVPAGLVLSAAEAVAVNVTEVPKAGLVLLADNVVVVAVFGGAPTVTTTAGEVEEAYELLVGVKTAVMLSAPEGSVLVGQVADVGGLMATAVQPLIGVVPFKNSTVPAGLVLSAAEAVAVNVTEVPKAGLVLLADNVVVVAVFGGAPTVTTTAGEVEEAYELLVGVKTAVMLSAPEGSVLVGQVADVGGLMATAVVHPVIADEPTQELDRACRVGAVSCRSRRRECHRGAEGRAGAAGRQCGRGGGWS